MKTQPIFYLVTKAPHNRSKRHIVAKSTDINYLYDLAKNVNRKYSLLLYSGNWDYIGLIRSNY